MNTDPNIEFSKVQENTLIKEVVSSKREDQGNSLMQIAKAFSNGEFSQVYKHFADDMVWNVVEEYEFIGKDAVIHHCEQVRKYFDSVTTEFKTTHEIVDKNKIVITGTGEFFRNSMTISFVSACDIYEFNNMNQIERITSYCIQRN